MALGLRLGLGCVGGVVSDFEAVLAACRFFLKIFQEKSNFFAKTFAQFKKSTYLCIAFQRKSGSKQSESSMQPSENYGRLAQLVQSVCLTSRGSAVRIRQRPPK